MTRVRTSDVFAQLRRAFDAEARAAAGSNTVLSRAEVERLTTPALKGAVASVRDGQPDVRVTVDRVVDEALKAALDEVGAVNVAGLEFLSRAEIDAVAKRHPGLAALLRGAYDTVRAGVPPTPPDVVDAARRALTPWAGGKLPPLDVRHVRDTRTSRIVEVDVRRNDGPTATFKVTLGVGSKAGQIVGVSVLKDSSPVTGPTVASLRAALPRTPPGAAVLGYVERTDVATGRSDFLVAWQTPRPQGGRDIRLSRLDLSGATPLLVPATLGPGDEATARTLALQMAKHQAYRLTATHGGDDARLEYHLRTAALRPASLEVTARPDESPVGFDPAREAFQFMLPSVWGDNAVVVTFAKDGTARLEDVN